MDAEVLLEYDAATRHYRITVREDFYDAMEFCVGREMDELRTHGLGHAFAMHLSVYILRMIEQISRCRLVYPISGLVPPLNRDNIGH